jgi:sterol desaturase/sphingolipid hydroxylase (fatty acid hydroxylase superfamily)
MDSYLTSMLLILVAMAAIAGVETLVPLHARGRWNRTHLAPNLTLTGVTFATSALFGAALGVALLALEQRGLGLLNAVPLGAIASTALVLLLLDLATWAGHVALHASPTLWRVHRVHHSDPALDVTTTIRQHPLESAVRFAFLAAVALPLGVSPAAFALYRAASALIGLMEHANVRLPRRLDDALALVTVSPNMHKVHHARDARLTDTNYGNLVSWWDRLFGTFTPAHVGIEVRCGLDGFDDPAGQTTAGLLALPFRQVTGPRRSRSPRTPSASGRTASAPGSCSSAGPPSPSH